jgi:hypothetical protein
MGGLLLDKEFLRKLERGEFLKRGRTKHISMGEVET